MTDNELVRNPRITPLLLSVARREGPEKREVCQVPWIVLA
jgi:hypothetical protein